MDFITLAHAMLLLRFFAAAILRLLLFMRRCGARITPLIAPPMR